MLFRFAYHREYLEIISTALSFTDDRFERNNPSSVSFKLGSTPFGSVRSGLPHPFPLLSPWASTSVLNAALVTSQWQHRFLEPTHNAEHEAGQAASTVFQVFGVTRPGIEPMLPALVARAHCSTNCAN